MDHTRHLAAVFRFDGNAVASVPGSDEGVLQIGMQGTVDHAGELGMDPVCGNRHAAAYVLQSGAGVVRDFFLGEDAAVNFIGKKRKRFDTLEQGGKGVLRRILPILPSVVFNAGGIFQKAGDSEKLRRRKRAADLQRFQAHTKLPVAAEGNASFFEQPGEGIPGFHLGRTDFFQIRHGNQIPAELTPRVGGGMFGETVYDFGIFKCI